MKRGLLWVKLLKIKLNKDPLLLILSFVYLTFAIFTVFKFTKSDNRLHAYNVGEIPLNKIDKIINLSEERKSENSEDIRAMIDLGLAYYQKGQYAESLNNLHRAYELGGQDIRIFYCSGLIYDRLNLNDYAAREYERYLRNKPNDFAIRLKLGNLYFRINQLDSAIDQYEIAYSLKPKDITVLFNLALAYQKKGLWDESEKMWQFLLRQNRRLPPEGYYYLGELFYHRGKIDKAKEFYNIELKYNPNFALAKRALEKINKNIKSK